MLRGFESQEHMDLIAVATRPLSWAALLVLMAAAMVGCGRADGLVPVSGRVTMNSAPLQDAVVRFFPQPGVKGNGGGASTDMTGSFTLISPQGKRGIFPGDYSITVSCRKPSAKAEQQIKEVRALGIAPVIIDRDMTELLPKAYVKPESSPLRVTVGAKGSHVPIEIDSASMSIRLGH